jgi:hypothetical protein
VRITVRESEKERERERKGSGVSPDYDTHRALTRTTKPSAAVRPSAAEKGVLGSPPTTIQHNTPTRTTSQAQWIRGIPPTAMQYNTPRSDNESDFKQPSVV